MSVFLLPYRLFCQFIWGILMHRINNFFHFMLKRFKFLDYTVIFRDIYFFYSMVFQVLYHCFSCFLYCFPAVVNIIPVNHK